MKGKIKCEACDGIAPIKLSYNQLGSFYFFVVPKDWVVLAEEPFHRSCAKTIEKRLKEVKDEEVLKLKRKNG